MDHVAECDNCRARLAGLSRALRSDDVISEVSRLDPALRFPAIGRSARSYAALASVLAAAAVALVLLWPGSAAVVQTAPDEGGRLHRESAITTTVAPVILAPAAPATPADSLVWTSVPHADRYRVRIFDLEGTLTWEGHTTDTTAVIPTHLTGATAAEYLWKVEARTGWDRWVVSDWRSLVIRHGEHPR